MIVLARGKICIKDKNEVINIINNLKEKCLDCEEDVDCSENYRCKHYEPEFNCVFEEKDIIDKVNFSKKVVKLKDVIIVIIVIKVILVEKMNV